MNGLCALTQARQQTNKQTKTFFFSYLVEAGRDVGQRRLRVRPVPGQRGDPHPPLPGRVLVLSYELHAPAAALRDRGPVLVHDLEGGNEIVVVLSEFHVNRLQRGQKGQL